MNHCPRPRRINVAHFARSGFPGTKPACGLRHARMSMVGADFDATPEHRRCVRCNGIRASFLARKKSGE